MHYSPGSSGLDAQPESSLIARLRNIRVELKRWLAKVRRQVSVRLSRIESHIFDLHHGTDTAGKMLVNALDDVVGVNLDHGTGYQPLHGGHFRQVMNSLRLPEGSVFVDIGSGKGKALLIAAEYGAVDRVIGIEFSGGLCSAARRNIDWYRGPREILNKIEIRHQDALLYEIEPDQNIFLLFNPFDGELLSSFIDKIEASLCQRSRLIWLIYVNPKDSEVIESRPAFVLQRTHRFYGPGRDIDVYIAGSSAQQVDLVAEQEHQRTAVDRQRLGFWLADILIWKL